MTLVYGLQVSMNSIDDAKLTRQPMSLIEKFENFEPSKVLNYCIIWLLLGIDLAAAGVVPVALVALVRLR